MILRGHRFWKDLALLHRRSIPKDSMDELVSLMSRRKLVYESSIDRKHSFMFYI